jgi:hypothetical protein
MDTYLEPIKQFVVDYCIGFNKQNIKSYMVIANSRKDAEIKTRNMEHPDKINILKINKIIFDIENDKILADCIAQHLSNNKFKDERDTDELEGFNE